VSFSIQEHNGTGDKVGCKGWLPVKFLLQGMAAGENTQSKVAMKVCFDCDSCPMKYVLAKEERQAPPS
jgi:hypothetical protein